MASKRKLLVIDGDTGAATPVGFKARNRVALPLTPKKALRAAASAYAATARGEMPPEIGTKLVYMARQCGDLAEMAEVEPRIAELEARVQTLTEMLRNR